MIRQFKKITVTVLLLCIVTILTSCGSISEKLTNVSVTEQVSQEVTPNDKQVSNLPCQYGITEETDPEFIADYIEVARNSNSILYADMNKGLFALQNIETEKIWYSTPNDFALDKVTSGTERMELCSQVLLYFVLRSEENTVSNYKIENSQSSCVSTGDIKVKKIKNGIKVVYTFRKTNIVIPITYTLTSNSFEAKILVDEIKEGKEAFLIGINLLPTFGASSINETQDGYLFVPDGCGALIDLKDHKNIDFSYNRMLYGNEMAVAHKVEKYKSESLHMPVFGTVIGNETLMGIISNGDTTASVSAICSSDNVGYNSVSSVFNYRNMDNKEMYSKQGGISSNLYRVSKTHANSLNFNVEYSMLSNDNSGYVGMAKKYREFLVSNNRLKQSKVNASLNLQVYGACDVVDTFLGVKYSTTKVLTTLKDTEKIVKDLKGKGIKKIDLRYMGISNSGLLNNKIVNDISPMRKIGNKNEFNGLCKLVTVYPDYDLIRVRSGGKGISLSKDVIKTSFNYKSQQERFSQSVYTKIDDEAYYLLNGKAILGAGKRLLKKAEKSNYKYISFTGIGNMLYSDYSENNPEWRNIACDYQISLLNDATDKNMSIAVESANAYSFKYIDKIWNAPFYSSGFTTFTTDVPFYQLVLHGIIDLTSAPIIQSQEPETAVLKAVETGSQLLFGCTKKNTTELIGTRFEDLYSTEYGNWSDYAISVYKKYEPLLSRIADSKICNHTEISKSVFKTDFENGISVIVNYSNNQYVTDDGLIVNSMDYLEIGGEHCK